MKTKKTISVTLSPKMSKEKREADAKARLMASVKEDQVWKHEGGTEYTTILISNRKATKPDYSVTVNYYGPDGEYWAQPLERFIQDKVFLRDYDRAQTPAEQELGGWLSASLDDDKLCPEYKVAVQNWFNDIPTTK